MAHDPLSQAERSERMALVRAKDTKPELRVRRLVHGMGYRYRLHYGKLPGKPDLVFPGRSKVVFVHGCFWHRHNCTMGKRLPKSRVAFWKDKLEGNRQRDMSVQRQLRKQGWDVLIVWECETAANNLNTLSRRLQRFLEGESE